jgi:hypothetical protein
MNAHGSLDPVNKQSILTNLLLLCCVPFLVHIPARFDFTIKNIGKVTTEKIARARARARGGGCCCFFFFFFFFLKKKKKKKKKI